MTGGSVSTHSEICSRDILLEKMSLRRSDGVARLARQAGGGERPAWIGRKETTEEFLSLFLWEGTSVASSHWLQGWVKEGGRAVTLHLYDTLSSHSKPLPGLSTRFSVLLEKTSVV